MKVCADLVSASIVLAGCATTTPPPERQYWDDATVSTVCTDTTDAVNLQSVGSLVLGGVGGWNVGTSLALGYLPIVGIGIASVGLISAVDADKK